MNYSKIQKFLSWFIIFSLLFSITFRVPMLSFSVSASSEDFFNLVSIVIDEETYGEIKSEVKRYSEDISWVLENTKVVILPVPEDVTPFEISSMNESLYFDWYKWLENVNFESKLIGSVFVWDIPLPVVYSDWESAKTVLPYTDFEDKSYIYNKEEWKYNLNDWNTGWVNPEIWHGFISPNNWDFDLNIDSLKSYFDKNNDFYEWKGFYDYRKSVINWNESDGVLDSYEPYVFYFDNFRETSALSYNSYIWYQWYLNNKEDITYNRYTKELADELKWEIIWDSTEDIYNLLLDVDDSYSQEDIASSDVDTSNTPDIQSRYIVDNAVKSFIEIFSEWSIWELRKNVYNSWRYNEVSSWVNVDFIPYLISVLDIVNDQIIKDINDELEVEVDDLVKNWLSRKLAIPTTYEYSDNNTKKVYENYLFWEKAKNINSAVECSIYRGSLENWWQLVEANRWLNINNIEADLTALQLVDEANGSQECVENIQRSALNWYWGKNSPFNLDQDAIEEGEMVLKNSDYKWAIIPLYDINGSTSIDNIEKTPNPYLCLDNNYILSKEENKHTENNFWGDDNWTRTFWREDYRLITYLEPWKTDGWYHEGWTCESESNDSNYNYTKSFDETYNNLNAGFCEVKNIYLDWVLVKQDSFNETCSISGGWSDWDSERNCDCDSGWTNIEYSYETVDSFITHKSATSDEISSQIEYMIAPSLAIDKNRYVDFIRADGEYSKINYPYLYRLKLDDISDINLDSVWLELDEYLDEKSEEINEIIRWNSQYSWEEDEDDFYYEIKDDSITDQLLNTSDINSLLSTWDYPDADFDLKSYLKNKWNKTLDIDWETKVISYYDVLLFALYWNNLPTASSKYGFVFENYLSDQVSSDDDFYLAKNKKLYEIAYLGSKWDSSNMYIWLDPESKNESPYSDIIYENDTLATTLLGLSVWTSSSWNAAFECAPPEWVVIWEWIPAIMCRLWDLLPATISLSEWTCSASLLTNDEIEELNQCNWDVNENGVNDCLEHNLWDGSIELSSDSNKYYYNSSAKLYANLKSSLWKDLTYISSTNVDFDIVKIEARNNEDEDFSETNKKIVFDIDDSSKNDLSIIDSYVRFTPQTILASLWKAQYWISFKNKDVNVFLRANVSIDDVNDSQVVWLDSNILKIEVRWDRLFSSTYNFSNTDTWLKVSSWNETVLASDETNVYLFDWVNNKIDENEILINNSSLSDDKLVVNIENISNAGSLIDVEYPLNIKLINDGDLLEELTVENWDYDYKELFSLSKTWKYTLQITDGFWYLTEENIVVTPWNPESLNLNLWTNILQTGWVISTNFVTIFDKYDNPVSWDFYELQFDLDWDELIFVDNEEDKLSISTYEWYSIFRLQSTQDAWDIDLNIDLYDLDWDLLISTNKEISVLDEINISLESQSWEFKVWGESNQYKLSVEDGDWNLLSDFNSRVYMIIDSMYLDLEKSYFEIKNWEWFVNFETKEVAWENIPVEFQIEWFNEIISDTIKILPEEPVKIDLVLDKSEMEASSDSFANLSVELKDRYNNLVFNDNETIASIEILEDYSNIIEYDNPEATFDWWKANFKIYWTINPWIWYFKVSTNPSLELNNFTVIDEGWNLEVNGVWENASLVETFYVWNKDKIENSNYNALYTTLLWSNYWDIDQKDYLAWSIVFDENSKALAATSLINLPYSLDNTLSISSNGWIWELFSDSDLNQDIEYYVWVEDDKLYLNLFNAAINTFIWKIFYKFDDEVNLEVCNWDISDCVENDDETTIFWKTLDEEYSFYTENNSLVLRNTLWKTILEIDENGNFSRKSSVNLSVDLSTTTNNLWIFVESWDDTVAYIWYNLLSENLNITRDSSVFENKKLYWSEWVYTFINSSLYWTYTSTKDEELIIYYNDPFGSTDSLNTFAKSNLFGYENFESKSWLWWSEWNKSLLSFSAWQSVWESVKESASFWTINIWDPVVSLKKIKKPFIDDENSYKQFDSSIWDVISNDSNVESYKIFDYDNNWLTDILLIKNDNYLSLLENTNTSEKFLNKWNLASITDLWATDLVQTWDFTWDWFDDIFFVGDSWNPYLLNNINKDFSRLSLVNKFDLTWAIVRAETFDMDNDWIDDIVTLDDSGQINIFYGWWSSANPVFTKLTVNDDYWIKLNWDKRNDGSLIYFDWVYQLDTAYDSSNLIAINQNYLSSVEETVGSWENSDLKENINTDMLNSFIFQQVAYDNSDFEIQDFEDLNSLPDSVPLVTFINWEFSESTWVKIEKIFKDRNGWFLSSWDIVDVEIKIINENLYSVDNVAYIEDVFDYFTLDSESIVNSKNLEVLTPNNSYEFMVDWFNLNWNEQMTISYTATVKNIEYGYMQVWLFETWEDWDDNYWDIILKDNNENCWEAVGIFRSVSTRLYNKWTKSASCDESVLPEEISQNNIDSDWDWIPDYIEDLFPSDNMSDEELAEYSQNLSNYSDGQLSDLFKDSDGDGIPDDEDSFNSQWSIVDNLSELSDNIDEWLDDLNNLVNSLSCWFSNWACYSTPLNWAPLAPGGDPTFMGYPVWDWLNVAEWIPVFSALTWMPVCPIVCIPVPSIFPISSSSIISYITPVWMDWAWGSLWVLSPTNFFRLFVTPTLTGWVWIAACFWTPAAVAWYANMPWLSPLFPGWNCIVMAQPIMWCSNDWSDWDPWSTWYPVYWDSFWIINWNCGTSWTDENYLDTDFASDYYDYVTGEGSSAGLSDTESAISDHSSTISPLFTLWDSSQWVSVWINSDSWLDAFWDVTQIVQTRIQAFPAFLMNWVRQQISEIVNKLTDFPTIFIILPDFSWIYDTDLSWQENKEEWLKNSWNSNETSGAVWVNSDIWEAISEDNITNDWVKTWVKWVNILTDNINSAVTTTNSWIKEAYEFIGSLPLVNIHQEPVFIELPWISVSEIDKTILSRELTLNSWQEELDRALDSWSYWATCNNFDENKVYASDSERENAIALQAECEEKNNISEKISWDIWWLISSLEKNIEVIKEYKKTPEKINELITKKEDYLEQILCNVEIISDTLWGWIWENWERFKSWVELYILIKAILKSWQGLIDVFVDFEEECKQCKNERWDLMTFIWELISSVIPTIPVVEFPKWPDIILDLHNIRAGLSISLPEFNISTKPIILPTLPNLYLPESPSLGVIWKLPDLPILPSIEIWELPDLPNLPSIELPNLPPAPTLPALITEISAVLDILKLVAKAMCIVKTSPFVPEWRAWDQIAFLTERNGYLSSDFLSVSLPSFSFSYIDAIEIKSYVNLEFETDFVVELAKQIVAPINSYTSDFSNQFNVSESDLDFRGIIPSEIELNWEIDSEWNNDWGFDLSDSSFGDKVSAMLAYMITKNIVNGRDYIAENKDVTISNEEFRKRISKNLAEWDFWSNSKLREIKNVWENVDNYTYSKEDKIISELQKYNSDKFNLVADILNTEIVKNEEFKKDFNEWLNSPIVKVSLVNDSNVDEYNNKLEVFNTQVFEKTSDLISYKDEEDSNKRDISESWENLLAKVEDTFTEDVLLAATNTSWEVNSCSTSSSSSDSWYVYEGLYILEDSKSYRLFDYLTELTGDETTEIIDFDNDSDEDLLYFSNNTLYLKENLSEKASKIYLGETASVIDIEDNKFINGDDYLESVNNVVESAVSSSIINVWFKSIENINNYRLSSYTLVDKFLNEENTSYEPKFRKKTIIDWVSWIWTINITSENDDYIARNDIVRIEKVWDLRWLQVTTDKFKNIKDDLNSWNVVILSNGTYLYSWNSTTVVKYILDWDENEEIKSIIIPKNSSIEVISNMNIVWIIWEWYVKTWIKYSVDWEDIRTLIGMPLSEWSKISYVWNVYEVKDNTYVELEYYDNSTLDLDFETVSSWELYDLWFEAEDYLFSMNRENDYYYWIINWFGNDIVSTSSKQILLSPQIQADDNNPELNLKSIRVPVYQNIELDITDNIFENTWIEWLDEVYIDFDLETDSSWDWDNKNDNDSDSLDTINIELDDEKVLLQFGKFDSLFEKEIGITLLDNNGNIWYYTVSLEVYTPAPEINDYSDLEIKWVIDEDLTDEPINIYRYRWWVLTKLYDENNDDTVYSDDWEYSFNLSDSNDWVTVKKDDTDVAFIDEETWKITLSSIIYSISVEESDNPNNELLYPKITIWNTAWDLFYETIKVDWNKSVEYVDSFEWIEDSWVYVQFLNKVNYNYYINPDTVSFNPWSMWIYRNTDENKEALFTIFRDGRINTINENYSLEYDYYDDYVALKLIDKHFNNEVASVLYKVNSDYIIN